MILLQIKEIKIQIQKSILANSTQFYYARVHHKEIRSPQNMQHINFLLNLDTFYTLTFNRLTNPLFLVYFPKLK